MLLVIIAFNYRHSVQMFDIYDMKSIQKDRVTHAASLGMCERAIESLVESKEL